MPGKRILLLATSADAKVNPSTYLVGHFFEYWRRLGHQVTFAYGVERYIPADVVILHVDLSIVPQEYLDYVRQYPLAINASCHSISKETYSPGILTPDSDYRGPVIVKTYANYGGLPEARAKYGRAANLLKASSLLLPWSRVPCLNPNCYPIYESLLKVPEGVWRNHRLFVQRFMPESDGSGRYFIRSCYFFGNKTAQVLKMSRNPTVKLIQTQEENAYFATSLLEQRVQERSIPAELFRVRDELGLDFGKIDWVKYEGKAVVLDVNKTASIDHSQLKDPVKDAKIKKLIETLADGLFDYFGPNPVTLGL